MSLVGIGWVTINERIYAKAESSLECSMTKSDSSPNAIYLNVWRGSV